jgi:hypothetical protein
MFAANEKEEEGVPNMTGTFGVDLYSVWYTARVI